MRLFLRHQIFQRVGIAAIVLIPGVHVATSTSDASASPSSMLSIKNAPGHDAMDFWLGDWEVRSNGELDGYDRVEKILNGAAILEHWTDTEGGKGESLFYFQPATGNWKQVWVTPAGIYK